MKTHLLLFGALISTAPACDSSDCPTSNGQIRTNVFVQAKAGKEVKHASNSAAPATSAAKPKNQQRAGRPPLPAHLFM